MITVIHNYPIWLPQTLTWMYNQARFLPDGTETHIVCEKTENLEQFYLPNIHCLEEEPLWRYYLDKGLRKLRVRRHLSFLVEQARRYHAQVLHSHFGNVGWANMGAAGKAKLKHVVTFYGIDVNCLPKSLPRWHDRYDKLFMHVDRVLCEGPYMARSLASLGCPTDKIAVHHLGINVDEIIFKPRVWNEGEPLHVLIAASFREKKGIPYALEALGRLQFEVPLEITIIGDADSRARSQIEKQNILAIIEKYHLQSRTRMVGYQPHTVLLQEAYNHHIFLSPSITATNGDTEGGAPVSIIEMAASGMPVISTTHCDIPEVVLNRVTGLLAEERDVEGIVNHIRWLIHNPAEWADMLRKGRQRVEEKFHALLQGERLFQIYSEVVGS